MIDLFKNTFRYTLLHMLKYIPWTREIYEKLATYKLFFALDFLKIQEMRNEAVCSKPRMLRYVPDCFKTQGLCNEAVEKDPWMLYDVPVHLGMQEMCEKVVRNRPCMLGYVPDGFKT